MNFRSAEYVVGQCKSVIIEEYKNGVPISWIINALQYRVLKIESKELRRRVYQVILDYTLKNKEF